MLSQPLISYAQNGEDIVLNRALKDINHGFYVDIGAADPVINSVTKLFYDRDWYGINVEPNSKFFQKLQKSRKRDININAGIGNANTNITLYRCTNIPEWSTYSIIERDKFILAGGKFQAELSRTVTLMSCLEQIKPKIIHLLKIDAEGFEEQILKDLDWKNFKPWVIVVEHTHINNWEPYILKHNYIRTLDDGINYFYLADERKEFKEKLSYPACALDNYVPYYYYKMQQDYEKRIKKIHRDFDKLYRRDTANLNSKINVLERKISHQVSNWKNLFK